MGIYKLESIEATALNEVLDCQRTIQDIENRLDLMIERKDWHEVIRISNRLAESTHRLGTHSAILLAFQIKTD
jgi:hypothetical protein